MPIAFCMFLKRDENGIPILKFIFRSNSLNLKVARTSMNMKLSEQIYHTDPNLFKPKEYDAIDFESLHETPCFGWYNRFEEFVNGFNILDEDSTKYVLSTTTTSAFTGLDVDPYWLSLCKRYDSIVESRLADEIIREASFKLHDVIKSDKERIIRKFIEYILPDVEDGLSEHQKEALHEAIETTIKKIKNDNVVNPIENIDFSKLQQYKLDEEEN